LRAAAAQERVVRRLDPPCAGRGGARVARRRARGCRTRRGASCCRVVNRP